MKLLIQLGLFILAIGPGKTIMAAFKPVENNLSSQSFLPLVDKPVRNNVHGTVTLIKPVRVKTRQGFKGKLMTFILKSRILKKIARVDEPTEHQRKLGRLSLILAAAAVVLLVIPYAALGLPAAIGVLCVPSAIAGVVLGIKSLRGNTNLPGLLGLIFSGSLLVLLILAVIILALLFSGGWM